MRFGDIFSGRAYLDNQQWTDNKYHINGGKDMERNIDDVINETGEKIAKAIRESGLPVSVLKLILSNILYQLNQTSQSLQSEGVNNAEN